MAFSVKMAMCISLCFFSAAGLSLQQGTNSTVASKAGWPPVFVPIHFLMPMPVVSKVVNHTIDVPARGTTKRPYRCEDIKKVFLCRRAKELLGLTCLGWGGSYCVPADKPKCSDYTKAALCNKAIFYGQLCLGWTPFGCLR
mmetsp:Transcript_51508/g.153982  ORF Transcript_51508/g.153982 Transcript_51508/m.153982 type:complete len:141 (+) Transcript_51508:64-486(+)